jgi:hypothetical protein
MADPIPTFYRIFFPTIDPIVASTGVIGNLFLPGDILKSYNPRAILPPALETEVLLQSSAGFLAGTMVLQIFLLRMRPHDIGVWKALQASIAVVDAAILGSVFRALDKQDRLALKDWRGLDWINVGVTGTVLAIRLAFCLGVGLGGRKGIGKGKRS